MFYDTYLKLCQEKKEKPYSLPMKLGAKANACVDQWKKGSTPRQPMLGKIADYFGVSIDYLLTGEERQPTKTDGLSEEESLIIQIYRSLPEAHRQALLAQVQALTPFLQAQGSSEEK